MASSFPVSSQGSQKYDVFLNFRGLDVRFNFLSYLILAFNQLSLNFFVDYKLKRGEHIKSALMEAIQDSKVALTIFSKGYASSSWCLDELVKIMECRETAKLKQKVLPVFYHVTPSDVRNVQSGVFAQDFTKHESDHRSRSKVPRWKASMEAAGDLSGRIVNNTSSEAHVLIKIVDDVLTSLARNYSMSNRGDDNRHRALFHHSISTQLRGFLHNQKEISSGKLQYCSNIQQQQRNVSIWTISKRQGPHIQEDVNKVLTQIRVLVEGNPSESHSNQSETSSSHLSSPISYRSSTTVRKMVATAAPTKSTLTNNSFSSGGGNNINVVNSYGLGSTMVPTSSVTQVGLPLSGNSFASGGGNNINGYGLGGNTVPNSSVSMSNGDCCYRLDLGNGNWGYGYPVDYGNGYCDYHVDLGNGNWSYYVDRGNGYLYQVDQLDQVDQPDQVKSGRSLSARTGPTNRTRQDRGGRCLARTEPTNRTRPDGCGHCSAGPGRPTGLGKTSAVAVQPRLG